MGKCNLTKRVSIHTTEKKRKKNYRCVKNARKRKKMKKRLEKIKDRKMYSII